MTDISKISNGTNTYNIKDTEARTGLSNKQDTLVSGTNIKTINGNSLLGSGNIAFPTVDLTYSGSSQNAQSGVAVAMAIDSAISSVYKPGGSVIFASLPTPGSTNEGYVYNVTDAFTTTSSFVEGAGIDYPAGTNVVIVEEISTSSYYAWKPSYNMYVYTKTPTPEEGDEIYSTGMINGYRVPVNESELTKTGTVDGVSSNTIYDIGGSSYNRYSTGDIGFDSIAYKFDTLTGAFQPLLVSGTNIKTINNESILGSGNISISSGSTYTAGSGINISNNTISVTSPVLINTSTGNNSITVLGTESSIANAMNIGYRSSVTRPGIAIGNNSSISGNENWACVLGTGAGAESARCGVAIGNYAQVKANYAIQIGGSLDTTSSVNQTPNTLSVYNGLGNYTLLSSDGTIPSARLNSMTGADGTNAGTLGAVPAPTATDNTKFLRGDGIWATPTMPIVDQTYDGTSTNAQSGTAIAGAGFLTNNATSPYSWVISNTASSQDGLTILGRDSTATKARSTVLGRSAQSTGKSGIVIGYAAYVSADHAIQIGTGTNSTADTLNIGFDNDVTADRKNWCLLDGTTGYIPNARINMDTTPTQNSTNAITSGAVYTVLGDLESAINTIRGV